jgi:hypothetical protein
MTGWDDPVVIATIVGAVAGGASGGAVSVLYDMRKSRLVVELERFEEHLSPPHSPTESRWSIRVRPNKMMEHCKVFVGTVQIPAAKGGSMPLETKIPIGGAENFRIPVSVNPFGDGDGQTITVKNDNKTVKKQGFRKIPLEATQPMTQATLADQPRIRTLIKKVLTPAIQIVENNDSEIVGGFLNRKNYPVTSLSSGSDPAGRLEFDDFKSKYPVIWEKVKAYDELSVDIEGTKAELKNNLAADVKAMLPSALKEYNDHHFLGGIVKWNLTENDIVPEQFVSDAIFTALEHKPPGFRSTLELFWELHKGEFIELTKKKNAIQILDKLRQLAQRSYDNGVKLAAELSQLREQLGSEFKIPRDEYFPKPAPIVLTP